MTKETKAIEKELKIMKLKYEMALNDYIHEKDRTNKLETIVIQQGRLIDRLKEITPKDQ